MIRGMHDLKMVHCFLTFTEIRELPSFIQKIDTNLLDSVQPTPCESQKALTKRLLNEDKKASRPGWTLTYRIILYTISKSDCLGAYIKWLKHCAINEISSLVTMRYKTLSINLL